MSMAISDAALSPIAIFCGYWTCGLLT